MPADLDPPAVSAALHILAILTPLAAVLFVPMSNRDVLLFATLEFMFLAQWLRG